MEDEEEIGGVAWAHRDNPAWARAVGYEPKPEMTVSRLPIDPSRGPDPMELADWSALTAMAWIASRDMEFVRCLAASQLLGRQAVGDIDLLRIACRHYDGYSVPIEEPAALADLMAALVADKLRAAGVDVGGRRELLPIEWQGAELFSKEGSSAGFVMRPRQPGVDIDSPSLKRDDVLRIWPALLSAALPSESAGPEIPQSAAARRLAARKWYEEERVTSWEGSPRGPKAADDFAELKSRFGLGRRDAQQIRNDLAPPRWKESGSKIIEV